jgi:hypothetical protein
MQDLWLQQQYSYARSTARPSSLKSRFGRKRDFFSLGSAKRREGVFRLSLKNGMYKDFTLQQEIDYIIRYTYS